MNTPDRGNGAPWQQPRGDTHQELGPSPRYPSPAISLPPPRPVIIWVRAGRARSAVASDRSGAVPGGRVHSESPGMRRPSGRTRARRPGTVVTCGTVTVPGHSMQANGSAMPTGLQPGEQTSATMPDQRDSACWARSHTGRRSGHLTGVIYIADLGLVVPLMLLAGSWVCTRPPVGICGGGDPAGQGGHRGLALCSRPALASRAGVSGAPELRPRSHLVSEVGSR